MKRPKPEVIGEINITPLTDIFLVLMIIMMVVTPLLDFTGLQTSRASNDDDKSANNDERPKAVTLTVLEDGTYVYEKEDASNDVAALSERLRAEAPEHPDGVSMQVAPKAPLGRLAEIMQASQSAGVKITVYQAEEKAANKSLDPPSVPGKSK